jgi:hypothetical protein
MSRSYEETWTLAALNNCRMIVEAVMGKPAHFVA